MFEPSSERAGLTRGEEIEHGQGGLLDARL
jgi:hypothetical protein